MGERKRYGNHEVREREKTGRTKRRDEGAVFVFEESNRISVIRSRTKGHRQPATEEHRHPPKKAAVTKAKTRRGGGCGAARRTGEACR